MTKLLDDALIYGSGAAGAQIVSHLLLAREPTLPKTFYELLTRYAAGSAIVAAALSAYALRHPEATARDAAALHWLMLLGCGGVVGAAHLAAHHAEEKAAKEAALGLERGAMSALRRQYLEEEHGHFPPAVIPDDAGD